MARSVGYVHALGYRWLNRLYDPLVRLTMRERRFKEQLLDQAVLTPSMRVLDVGCGTGTLLMLLARRQVARAVGFDGDQDILAIARKKQERAGARFARALDGAAATRTNLEGRLPDFFRQAGFAHVEVRLERRTPLGTLAFPWRVECAAMVLF